MMIDPEVFAEQKGPKVFRCNFNLGPQPIELLASAVSGLSQIVDKVTGQPAWRIPTRPLQPPAGNAANLLATNIYPYGMVGLDLLAAIAPEMVVFEARFRDSLAWSVASAEQNTMLAMKYIDLMLMAHYPSNGGWAMVQGYFNYHDGDFGVPRGLPPLPPESRSSAQLPPEVAQPPLIDPHTSRLYWVSVASADPAAVIELVRAALIGAWKTEVYSEEYKGKDTPCLSGKNLAWETQSLEMVAVCATEAIGNVLSVQFGDGNGWRAEDAKRALTYSVSAINASLQTRLPGIELKPFDPSGSAAS